MADPYRVIIVGAGPAGLTAALSLASEASTAKGRPIFITVLERRSESQPTVLGGAVNLTPLALRYLDAVGAGKLVRAKGRAVSAIEIVSGRTGGLLSSLWPNADAVRVMRQDLANALTEATRAYECVQIVYGAHITKIEQDEERVEVQYTIGRDATDAVSVTGDVLVGCDGIHSQVRSAVVEPTRTKSYSGTCSVNGYATITPEDATNWVRSDGQPLITDTTMVQHGPRPFMLTYYSSDPTKLYLAALMPMPDVPADESGSTRDGWAVRGGDQEALKTELHKRFGGDTNVGHSLGEIITKCDHWALYPVYTLPEGGIWCKGRTLLIGDAAHAMPPQGESTGVAIEDGVLLAHVLSRRDTRSVPAMLDDYEHLRRSDINETYNKTMQQWKMRESSTGSWIGAVITDWVTWAFVKYLNWSSDHFGRDVRLLELPR